LTPNLNKGLIRIFSLRLVAKVQIEERWMIHHICSNFHTRQDFKILRIERKRAMPVRSIVLSAVEEGYRELFGKEAPCLAQKLAGLRFQLGRQSPNIMELHIKGLPYQVIIAYLKEWQEHNYITQDRQWVLPDY